MFDTSPHNSPGGSPSPNHLDFTPIGPQLSWGSVNRHRHLLPVPLALSNKVNIHTAVLNKYLHLKFFPEATLYY